VPQEREEAHVPRGGDAARRTYGDGAAGATAASYEDDEALHVIRKDSERDRPRVDQGPKDGRGGGAGEAATRQAPAFGGVRVPGEAQPVPSGVGRAGGRAARNVPERAFGGERLQPERRGDDQQLFEFGDLIFFNFYFSSNGVEFKLETMKY